MQGGRVNWAIDLGTVNALAATLDPAPNLPLLAGLTVRLYLANGITGPATFNLNASGANPVVMNGGAPFSDSILGPGAVADLCWDGVRWQCENVGSGFSKVGLAWQTAGTYSFTVPAGVYRIYGKVVGAGGSGGSFYGSFGSTLIGGCGGGGGVAEGFVDVTPGNVISITVGAGGASANNANGNAGGTSSLGSLMSATGGAAGTGGISVNAIGGLSGRGTGGTINTGLGAGSNGILWNGTTVGGPPGNGGGPGGQSSQSGTLSSVLENGGGGGGTVGYATPAGGPGAVYIWY